MSLLDRLIARIAAEGPISIADYMIACLHDPEHGYYATRPALGAQGDFITAPLVSQMFGELIGLWAAEAWRRLGAPDRFTFAEFGPGDGTMMADMLRAAGHAPGFLEAAAIWLVETSAPLRRIQARTLAAWQPAWAAGFDELPAGPPLIAIGNEFLDCLPIGQAILTIDGWRERRIGAQDCQLAFVIGPPASGPKSAPTGAIHETSAAVAGFSASMGARLARARGVGLMIDYGAVDGGAFGDTLQAVRGHAKENPLANPGSADLTAAVDFAAFLAAAQAAGAHAAPLESQAMFLARLGLNARAQALRRARPDKAGLIDRQVERLVGARQMGALFKVARLHSPGVDPP